jgi:hypothetical protein
MNAKEPRSKHGPEHGIQKAIIAMLRDKGWYVLTTHGNMYQSGFPDLYATHSVRGIRWIEVKDPERSGDVFTVAQHETFPKLAAYGTGIWVLTGASESEYEKLFKKPNWWMYLQAFKVGTHKV